MGKPPVISGFGGTCHRPRRGRKLDWRFAACQAKASRIGRSGAPGRRGCAGNARRPSSMSAPRPAGHRVTAGAGSSAAGPQGFSPCHRDGGIPNCASKTRPKWERSSKPQAKAMRVTVRPRACGESRSLPARFTRSRSTRFITLVRCIAKILCSVRAEIPSGRAMTRLANTGPATACATMAGQRPTVSISKA